MHTGVLIWWFEMRAREGDAGARREARAQDFLEKQDLFFGLFFFVEMLIRTIALTPQVHFSENWQIVDGFITCGVVISAFIPDTAFASFSQSVP